MSDTGGLNDKVITALRSVRDPELPVNIYDLGLIYELDVSNDGHVRIIMTLTSPNCPVAEQLPGWAEQAVRQVPGVGDVRVELTFDPPWSRDRIPEATRLELNLDDLETERRPFVSADDVFKRK